MEADQEPIAGGYTLALFGLGLALGVLTIRVRYQQKLDERNAGGEIVVTQDFKKFQATFMSECGVFSGSNRGMFLHFLLLFEGIFCVLVSDHMLWGPYDTDGHVLFVLL